MRTPPGRARARWAALAAAALLASAPRAAAAGGFNVGGGGGLLAVSSDALSGSGRGGGYTVFTGYRFTDRLTLDLAVTALGGKPRTHPTQEISYPADRAEVSVIDLRLRVDLVSADRHRVIPWLGAGLGVVTLTWQEFFYSEQGLGPSLAAGVDVRIAAGLFARGALAFARARTSDAYGHDTPAAAVVAATLGVGWQFGWSPLPAEPGGPRDG